MRNLIVPRLLNSRSGISRKRPKSYWFDKLREEERGRKDEGVGGRTKIFPVNMPQFIISTIIINFQMGNRTDELQVYPAKIAIRANFVFL